MCKRAEGYNVGILWSVKPMQTLVPVIKGCTTHPIEWT